MAIRDQHMSDHTRELKQKVAAQMAGLSLSAGMAYATAGNSLLWNTLMGGSWNTAGGMLARGIDGDESTTAVDKRAIATDAGLGATGVLASARILRKKEVVSSIDSALGAGGARTVANATSNVLPPTLDKTSEIAIGFVKSVMSHPPNPAASDPSVNCHIPNTPIRARAQIEVRIEMIASH
jgi:hypothetical protein